MFRIASTQQIRQLEAAADTAGISYSLMMQRAGQAIAQRAHAWLQSQQHTHILVLVGKGNNGGDGLVAARLLASEYPYDVSCYLLHPRSDDPLYHAALAAGVQSIHATQDRDYQQLTAILHRTHLLIDGLLGIGIRLPLRDDIAHLLSHIQHITQQRRQHSDTLSYTLPDTLPTRPLLHTLAIDCPSGLDCDTGAIAEQALPADETITFIAAKPGLLQFPGAAYVGQLTGALLDLPDDLPEFDPLTDAVADAHYIGTLLPQRYLDSNKGTHGKVLICGGCADYHGAPGLSATAAYRAGAGLVTLSVPPEVRLTLGSHLLEATFIAPEHIRPALSATKAALLGPGWGTSAESEALLHDILQSPMLPPLVIDADGLNLLARRPGGLTQLPPQTILTPHPGEMARLVGCTTAEVVEQRWELAREKAIEWQVVLLLKGAHTLIAAPSGQITALPFKTDALAKAGSGDVLAGIIAGLLAQGIAPYAAAVAGGYLHGLAGTIAARAQGTSRSLLAHEISDALPEAFSRLDALRR